MTVVTKEAQKVTNPPGTAADAGKQPTRVNNPLLIGKKQKRCLDQQNKNLIISIWQSALDVLENHQHLNLLQEAQVVTEAEREEHNTGLRSL